MIKNIGVIGVGGVGGYFGGKLCQLLTSSNDLHISFVARGEHLRVIQESGLLLSSEQDGDLVCKPSLATDDFSVLPSLDLCLLCVKEFDLARVLESLKPLVGTQTVILPLLNGVDVYSRVRQVISNGVVLPACVYVGTHIERPGKVFQKGGACKILFGPDPSRPEFIPGDLLKLFEAAKIKSEWTETVQAEIWKKFIFICAYGLVSAAYDKTVGQILDDDSLKLDVETIMAEVVEVARKSGIELPGDIIESSVLKAKTFPHQTKTSFQRDFEKMEKPDERDLFGGSMIRLADLMGIKVPKTTEIFETLIRRKP
jgi:2-dehydropantoate 2-reductase